MNPAGRSKMLTGSVTAHVMQQEEQQMKERAAELGISKSEWCRRTLLNALTAAPETRLLLSELAALRALFLTLHLDTLKGYELTEERLKQLVEKSEREKFAMADKRIHTYRSQELQSASGKNPGEVTS